MAQTIKLKRSAVAAKVPLTTDIALGELAINTYDGKMYFKKNVLGTDSIVTLANDNEVVKLTGTQSIAGEKTFTSTITRIDSGGNTALHIGPGYALTLAYDTTNGGSILANNIYTISAAWLNGVYNNNAKGRLFFRSTPEATNGGELVFGAHFTTGAAQSGVYGSIQNLKVPATDYEAANKKYVDDEIDNHNHSLASLTGVSITSPTSGQVLKYNGSNWINGTDETGGGGVSTDTIWDAKGDLAVGTGADTAAKLSVGTNGHVLMADSAQTTGVKWAEVVTLDTNQLITGSKVFSAGYTNITGTLATKNIQLAGSTVGHTLFFSTDSTATNGGTIIFGTDNGANAQATPKGSIQNLGAPVNDNDAARKKYVDDQVATKANDTDVVKLTGDQTIPGVKTFSSVTTVSNTTESTAITNGALVVSGGIGVSKNIYSGGNLVLSNGSGISFESTSDPTIEAVAATGSITRTATNVSDGDTVTIGTTVYTFKTTLTPTDWEVLISPVDAAGSLTNLRNAILGTGGNPGDYQVPNPHPTVTASAIVGSVLPLVAITAGTAGNSIALSETSAQLSVSAATLREGRAAQGATSEIMDDYEEGTWTPFYVPQTNSFGALTMDVIGATYTKVGKQVSVNAYIRTSEVQLGSATGNLRIGGLPYLSRASNRGYGSLAVGYVRAFAASGFPTGGYVEQNSTQIWLTKRNTSNGEMTYSKVTDLTTGIQTSRNLFIFGATYIAQ